MSRPALDLVPGRAPEGSYKKPMSFDTVVKSRRKVKIDPINQTSYSYAVNRNIRFQFGAAKNAFDLFASYFCFTLQTTGTTDGSVEDLRRYLASGGAHCLIKRFLITTMAGTPIEFKDYYHSQVAFFSKLYQSPDILDGVMFPEGNSLGKENYNLPQLGLDGYSYKLKGEVNGASTITYTAADDNVLTSTITMNNHALATELVPGDEILIRSVASGANCPIYKGIVNTITAASHIFTVSPALGVTIPDNATVWRKPLPPRVAMCSPANTSGTKLYMKPFMGLFMMDTYFPLWLTDGIIIDIELETPDKCIILSDRYALSASATNSFTITNPHFYVQSIEYDDVTQAAWEEQWRSGEGLMFHMRNYVYDQSIRGNGATAITVPINVEALSLKAIYAFIQSPREWTNAPDTSRVTATQAIDPHARYYDAGLKHYQYRQGSNLYPPAPVYTNEANIDGPMVEAWAELLEAMGVMYMQHRMSIPFAKWWKQNPSTADAGITTEAAVSSHNCIMAANFSAYDGPFGGLFTRNNRYIYLDMVFSDAFDYSGDVTDSRYLRYIIERDCILQIQKDIGTTLYT